MLSFLAPTYYAETVFDVDFERIYGLGISVVIFDIDNTLATYDEAVPNEKVVALLKKLRTIGFKISILSNGHSERAIEFSKELNASFEGDSFKPRKRGYVNISNQYNVTPNECIMIGDQLFTDIWGANRFLCKSILVKPIKLENEPGFVKFKRVIEKIIIKKLIIKAEKF